MKVPEVARKINIFNAVIYNFLKNPNEYGKKKRTGRPPTLIMCQKRAIVLRVYSEKESSA